MELAFQMMNPITQIFNDKLKILSDESEEEIELDKSNISKYFKHIFVLCPIKEYQNIDIYKERVTPDELNKILSHFLLYKTSIRIVKNDFHFNNIREIPKSIIEVSNIFNYDLDENVLILPILNINFLNLQNYLDNFEEYNDFDSLYNLVVINDYFGSSSSNNYKNNYYIEKKILNLSESDYWCNIMNCKLNMTKEFSKRNFNIKKLICLNSDVNQLLSELKDINMEDNYIEEIFKFKKYVDPSNIINKHGYKLYYIQSSPDYNKTDIFNLLSKLDYQNGFMLFCKLLVSKKFSHLVFSIEIFDYFDKSIKENLNLIQYLLSYTWIRFYMEESIKKSYLKHTDDVIFTIDMAAKLPVFITDPSQPYLNPYLPVMTSYKELNPDKNICGVQLQETDIDNRIATLSEFKDRMNIFISGNSSIDVFNGLDFKKNKMAISGSLMTACLQYKHPLIKLFCTSDKKSNDEILYRYFNEYYCESDIDIMIKSTDNFEFFDIVENICSILCKNIILINNDFNNNHLKKVCKKTIYFYISEDYLKTTFSNIYEIIISNLSSNIVKKLFYNNIKNLHNKKIDYELENFNPDEISAIIDKYSDFFQEINFDNIIIRVKGESEKIDSPLKLSDEELEKILEPFYRNEPVIDNIDEIMHIYINLKYHISCPFLDHNFEIFPIRGDDFFNVVNTFHLPCVRSFYDGEQVYMTPSCISAHLTYMNINYKYVAGTKDPLDIINKYRMRGFGTYLNKTEIKLYLKYITKFNFWKNLFDVDLNNPKTYTNALGYLDPNHKLFHPRLYNAEHYSSNNKIRYLCLDGSNLYVHNDSKVLKLTNHEYLEKRYNTKKIFLGSLKRNFVILSLPKAQDDMSGYINPLQIQYIGFILKSNNDERENNISHKV